MSDDQATQPEHDESMTKQGRSVYPARVRARSAFTLRSVDPIEVRMCEICETKPARFVVRGASSTHASLDHCCEHCADSLEGVMSDAN